MTNEIASMYSVALLQYWIPFLVVIWAAWMIKRMIFD